MLMAGMTPAFCARQLGHSIEMFLRTYARWIDGAQNEAEMDRLEVALGPKTVHELSTEISVTRNDLISKEKTWGDRWDSNPRRPESQSGTLPTELRSPLNCTYPTPATRTGLPGGNRTPDLQLRRLLLYPTELPAVVGRGGEIRTPDPLLPKQMRYQAALHPESWGVYQAQACQ